MATTFMKNRVRHDPHCHIDDLLLMPCYVGTVVHRRIAVIFGSDQAIVLSVASAIVR